MPIMDSDLKARRRKRVVELLTQGLTTRQIAERTGVTTRQVLRIKKSETSHVGQAAFAQHAQSSAAP